MVTLINSRGCKSLREDYNLGFLEMALWPIMVKLAKRNYFLLGIH